MSHTPEPWAVDPLYGFVIDKNCEPIELSGSYEASLNLDRAIACVNACAGVHDNYLQAVTEEGGAIKFFNERDELLAALKSLEKRAGYMAHCCGFFTDDVNELVVARAVIAKCGE